MTATSMQKTVAVAGGTGGLGSMISEELLKSKAFKVIILTRDASKCSSSKLKGAEFRTVDYSNEQSIKEQLKGVQVLVSALATGAVGDEQIRLAKGAKSAGVSLFLPSEFGLNTSHPEVAKMEVLAAKIRLAEHCSKIGLKTVRVMSGCFIDTFFLPWFGCDFGKGVVDVVGEGNQVASFTHRSDVARFVCQILTNDIQDPVVLLSGQCSTVNNALKSYENIKNKKLTVKHESIADTEKRIKTASDAWERGLASIKLAIEKGYGYHSKPLEPKGFKPISIEEYFRSL